MALNNLLPLGSIVSLNNGISRVMVNGRGLQVKMGEEIYYFDYAGVLYPEGLMGEQVVFFNNDWIDSIYFIGFNDELNREAEVRIQRNKERLPEIKRYPKPEGSATSHNDA